MSFSPYSSSLDPLVFGSVIEPKRSDIELENNLSLWTNVQFTHEPKSISSSPESMTASLSGEDPVNYYELEQKQMMSTEQRLISNKTPIILPKISPSMTLEEMSRALLIASAVYNTSLPPVPSPQHEHPKKDPAEEEKRKRNTAASARFRIKKKQREQTMERTVKEMTEKSTTLEKRVKELELEIKFLRNLLIEKNT